MNKDKLINGIGNAAFIITAIIVVGSIVWGLYFNKVKPPVEKNKQVDSLIVANDSIKIKVKELDSIKNAEVIEVYSLDDDSTVKLFYKLVKE